MKIVHNEDGFMIIKEDKADPCQTYNVPKITDDILVVKVGNEERPASEADIEGIKEMLAMAKKTLN